ncbi:hypothetical protein AGMMS49960_03020 [Betaproteobacteria bacterium]|nr:hypothetical protein AGMMS49543_01880 [Betaproteobacteria bacterium]GHT98937.1 hypothetical protein AGMMS49960_03020 [Betaproteobacteria bacterium]GHU19624.1 hypothetical protein AGMMS50243_12080 [Betaproteobacteria bacterium]
MNAEARNTLAIVRKQLLDALDDRRYGTAEVQESVRVANAKESNLFMPHEEDTAVPISDDRSDWHRDDYRYYVAQKRIAADNFSEKRWNHLVAVRDHFRNKNYKGFAPLSAEQPASTGSNMDQSSHSNERATAAVYQPSNNLLRAMKNGLTAIRVALVVEFGDASLSKSDLLAAQKWVESQQNGSGLFEPHEEDKFTRAMQDNREAWTVGYYDQQVVDLKNYFSEKRFQHVLKIREHLRQRHEPGFAPQPKPQAQPSPQKSQVQSYGQPSRPTSSSEHDSDLSSVVKKILLIGGALAAALLVLLALGR